MLVIAVEAVQSLPLFYRQEIFLLDIRGANQVTDFSLRTAFYFLYN